MESRRCLQNLERHCCWWWTNNESEYRRFCFTVEKLNADHIFILPNNSNIVLAASQVTLVCSDQDIHVLPSKTIPQGLSACVMFNPDVELEDNLA